MNNLLGAQEKLFALKSAVMFRAGFDDSAFANTILFVEPTTPFVGTKHLDALNYKNIDLKHFYPYSEK